MSIEIKIPAMGESVSEASISAILKPAGSLVRADEEIIEIETDKVNQVLYAPGEGVITWRVSVGDRVIVGQVIGLVEPALHKEEQPAAESKIPVKETPVETPPQAPVQETREIAHAHPATRKPMSSLRKVLARRLVEAKNQTAMLTTFNEIDMSAVMDIRAREKKNFEEKYGARLGFMSFFVKASVSALQEVPEVNSYIDGEDIVSLNTYDIGVAVSTDRGLVVPVIRGCDTLSFGDVEKAIVSFADKAKSGRLSVDDLRGGSFTITNGGVFGSLLSTPILNPPQSAILGMHTIVKRPVVVDDAIVIRPMMYVALSYDHRILDGKEAVLFLVNIKKNLEDPARLLLEM